MEHWQWCFGGEVGADPPAEGAPAPEAARQPWLGRKIISNNDFNELPSAQSIFIECWAEEALVARATGTLVSYRDRIFLVTNGHVVTGRRPGTNQLIFPSPPVSLRAYMPISEGELSVGAEIHWRQLDIRLVDDGYRPLWHEHPTLGERADIVALTLPDLGALAPFAYALPVEPRVRVGPSQRLSIVGFPFGLSGGDYLGIWVTGFIASEPSVDIEGGIPYFLIDSRTRQGMSGSPVIFHSREGYQDASSGNRVLSARVMTEFLGIYSGRINEESDLGKVWRASAVAELVAAIP